MNRPAIPLVIADYNLDMEEPPTPEQLRIIEERHRGRPCLCGHGEYNFANKFCCIQEILNQAQELFVPYLYNRNYEGEPNATGKPTTYDQCLKRWQITQTALAYIDNTINSLFDDFSKHHNCLPSGMDVEAIRSCMSASYLVDEGIAMAIRLHGLHPVFANNRIRERNQPQPDNEGDVANNPDFIDAAVSAAITLNGLHT